MKILWENYLTDSTITATSENVLYPVENLYNIFLRKKYMAVTTSAKITVTFPEDRPVSMIAFGYSNVLADGGDKIVITRDAPDKIVVTKDAPDKVLIQISAGFKLKSSTGAIVGDGVLKTGEDTNCTYFDEVTCRSVEIFFASDQTLFIGGLSVGSPLHYEYHQVNPAFIDALRDSVKKTDGGQIIGKQIPMLREWRVTIPDMENDKRHETRQMLRVIGSFQPVFVDLYDLEDNTEPAMYGNFIKAGEYMRDSQSGTYGMAMMIQEAR